MVAAAADMVVMEICINSLCFTSKNRDKRLLKKSRPHGSAFFVEWHLQSCYIHYAFQRQRCNF